MLKRRKTSTKQRTLHPVYNEALQFSIVKASLVDLTLDFEVRSEKTNKTLAIIAGYA